MTTLHDGIIPIGQPCPWEKQRPIAEHNLCRRGDEMKTNFSCASARLFDAARMPTDEMRVIEGAEDG